MNYQPSWTMNELALIAPHQESATGEQRSCGDDHIDTCGSLVEPESGLEMIVPIALMNDIIT